jgi:hypothetical protein
MSTGPGGLQSLRDGISMLICGQKPQFKNGGFGSLVLQQLNSLKTASGNLATALGNKVTAGNKQTVANLAAETAANFDKAIAEFS